MPSNSTRGARSATRLCTPRSRIRAPMPFTPEPGTTSRPGAPLVSTSLRLRAPRSRTAVAASMVDCGEAAGAGGLVSAALWARRDRPRSVRISPTATRREQAFMALEWAARHAPCRVRARPQRDRESTRLNSSHSQTSYALFCLKKNKDELTHLAREPFAKAVIRANAFPRRRLEIRLHVRLADGSAANELDPAIRVQVDDPFGSR